jgi:S-adenosylmethionine:tRNA ribosyltransferase-isomerase
VSVATTRPPASVATAAPVRFELPAHHAATAPPEQRGLSRDQVRLLVADGTRTEHARFNDLPRYLRPGDLLVVNTSGTLPAAVDTRRAGRAAVLHFSTELSENAWNVELRPPDPHAHGPLLDATAGDRLPLPDGSALTLVAPYPADGPSTGSRLWRADRTGPGPVVAMLHRHGRPIRYDHVPARWPLRDYQTVFAVHPGSAEMPSAGRPFTAELVARLVTRGVAVAPVLLHTGVSSQEAGEPPYEEPYEVTAATARLVAATRAGGGRVIAVGTTVVRALETVAGEDGGVRPGRGWTDLVLGPDRPARLVDAIVSGLHAPGASHLQLLEAVVGTGVVQRAYDTAVRRGYLWHEFGDSSLLLRDQGPPGRPW